MKAQQDLLCDKALATAAHWRKMGHSQHAADVSACFQLLQTGIVPTLAHARRMLAEYQTAQESARVTNTALATGAL